MKALIFIILFIFSTHVFSNDGQVEVLEEFNFSKLDKSSKIEVLKIYKDFLLNHQSTESLEEVTSHFFKWSFVNEAYAAEAYNCLFAGWPSVLKNGHCTYPTDSNEHYKSYKQCDSTTDLLCNPVLFGEGLCTDVSSSDKRQNAFKQCEAQFKKEGRNLDEIVDKVSDSEFLEATQTINQVCNAEESKQYSSPTCVAIKEKMQKYVPNLRPTHLPAANAALHKGDVEAQNRAYEDLLRDLQTDQSKFDKECMEDPLPDEKLMNCKALAGRMKKASTTLNKLQSSIEHLEVAAASKARCEALKSTSPQFDQLNNQMNNIVGKSACTEKDKEELAKNCSKEMACMLMSSTIGSAATFFGLTPPNQNCLTRSNNCFAQLATALAKYLLGMMKDVWGMIKSAGSWCWNKLFGAEDASSDKQNQINTMSDAEKSKASSSPLDWVKEKAQGIWGLITNFVKQDIFCQDPGWDTNLNPDKECKNPLKDFGCLGCGALGQGLCRAGGIILAEAGGFMTGVGAGVAVGEKAAEGLKALRVALKASGKYSKVVESVEGLYDIQKLKKLSYVTKIAEVTTKGAELSVDIIKKTFKVTKSTFSKLKKSKAFIKSQEIADKILATKVGKAAKKVVEVSEKVDEKAFKLGYESVNGGTKAVAKVASAAHKVEDVKKIEDVASTVKSEKTLAREASAGHAVNPEEVKVAQTTPIETIPVEVKPVEVKPIETTPVEVKPVEVKPIETTPVEVKPVEVKPIETTQVEVKHVEPKTNEVKHVESKKVEKVENNIKSNEEIHQSISNKKIETENAKKELLEIGKNEDVLKENKLNAEKKLNEVKNFDYEEEAKKTFQKQGGNVSDQQVLDYAEKRKQNVVKNAEKDFDHASQALDQSISREKALMQKIDENKLNPSEKNYLRKNEISDLEKQIADEENAIGNKNWEADRGKILTEDAKNNYINASNEFDAKKGTKYTNDKNVVDRANSEYHNTKYDSELNNKSYQNSKGALDGKKKTLEDLKKEQSDYEATLKTNQKVNDVKNTKEVAVAKKNEKTLVLESKNTHKAKIEEVKVTEVKAAEVKPIETTPVEVKPVEVKPIETTQVEVKHVEPKTNEVKHVESKKVEKVENNIKSNEEIHQSISNKKIETENAKKELLEIGKNEDVLKENKLNAEKKLNEVKNFDYEEEAKKTFQKQGGNVSDQQVLDYAEKRKQNVVKNAEKDFDHASQALDQSISREKALMQKIDENKLNPSEKNYLRKNEISDLEKQIADEENAIGNKNWEADRGKILTEDAKNNYINASNEFDAKKGTKYTNDKNVVDRANSEYHNTKYDSELNNKSYQNSKGALDGKKKTLEDLKKEQSDYEATLKTNQKVNDVKNTKEVAVAKKNEKTLVLESKNTHKAKIEEVKVSETKISDPKASQSKYSLEKGKVTSDADGSWYVGYDKVSMKNAEGKEIGFLSYHIDEKEKDLLEIGWSKVDEAERGKGHQTKMFDELFKQHPEVTRIRTSLDEVNNETFNKELSELLKQQPDFKVNTKSLSEKSAGRFTKKNELGQLELNSCCTEYLEGLKKSNPEKYEELFDQAVKKTPAWKTREKYGFGNFGDQKNYYTKFDKDGEVSIKIEFEASKVPTKQGPSNSYFKNLEGNKKVAWDQFKKDIKFDELPKDKQQALIDQMYKVHKNNNGSFDEVLMGKKRDLVEVQKTLVELGVSKDVAKEGVRSLSSKENRILGESFNPSEFKQYGSESNGLGAMKKNLKDDISLQMKVKDDYGTLLNEDKRLQDLMMSDSKNAPKYMKERKSIKEQRENIEAIYPKKAELDEVKNNLKNKPAAAIVVIQLSKIINM